MRIGRFSPHMIRKMIDCQKKFTINDMAIEVMDGVAIGAPAFYTQAFFLLNELFRKQLDDPSSILANPFANTQVRQAVLERCDGLDGYVDGVIDWPHRCDPDIDELGADIGLSANDIALLKEAVSPRTAIGNSSIGPIAWMVVVKAPSSST